MEEILIHNRAKRNIHDASVEGFRGSIFRGVSKNKNKWQVRESDHDLESDLNFYILNMRNPS